MKRRIVSASPSSKKSQPDWNKLWDAAKNAYAASGMDRQKSTFENFEGQKEEICRVMNIVCPADLARLQRQLAEKTKG